MPGQKREAFALDVPGIHVLRALWQGVDGRDKPGRDGCGGRSLNLAPANCDEMA